MHVLPLVLALLPATALASPLYMSVPENRIMKAGDFKRFQAAAREPLVLSRQRLNERDAINIMLASRAAHAPVS
ncbi:hypothetical protein PHLGIDRAFT_129173 [Phlebiopsis gigantea 11061_1 CR5-6]|uniref:Uncharacterized protein n=1 Tax=Phlebiopsis gigantea (strain 11061_1 CR5-6) TaxID=745531 RepID=A0A0C3NJ68_PHLG1|nr:hypothetical protein PHLGIDRAFT_129173 [Phlebiopsis gigantea 11061_1 CR5-6]